MENMSIQIRSGNKKTGPIPVSITSKDTCPSACPLKNNGCYADSWPLGLHWVRVTDGNAKQTDPNVALETIANLPDGQLWRHNQAGDLPGKGNRINRRSLRRVTKANKGKKGFTYTHKPPTARNLELVREANAGGFTVNLSANTLAHADELVEHKAGPVVVVLDSDTTGNVDVRTPAGRRVVVCPATYRDDVTCASCALCAIPDRKEIIGFPAHGAGKRKASNVAKDVSRGNQTWKGNTK